MSLIKLCDICGKSEGASKGIKKAKPGKAFNSKPEAVFDERPIRLSMPSYDGQRYNIYVDIKLEHEEDTKLIDNFYNTKSNFMEDLIGGNQDLEVMIDELSVTNKPLVFNNPYPKICSSCKREILKLARAYGSESGMSRI